MPFWRALVTFAVLGAAVFLASGFLAFIRVFLDHSRLEFYDVREIGLTPAVTAFLIFGVMGNYLLYLAAGNMKKGLRTLGKKQFWAGFVLLGSSTLALEILFSLVR